MLEGIILNLRAEAIVVLDPFQTKAVWRQCRADEAAVAGGERLINTRNVQTTATQFHQRAGHDAHLVVQEAVTMNDEMHFIIMLLNIALIDIAHGTRPAVLGLGEADEVVLTDQFRGAFAHRFEVEWFVEAVIDDVTLIQRPARRVPDAVAVLLVDHIGNARKVFRAFNHQHFHIIRQSAVERHGHAIDRKCRFAIKRGDLPACVDTRIRARSADQPHILPYGATDDVFHHILHRPQPLAFFHLLLLPAVIKRSVVGDDHAMSWRRAVDVGQFGLFLRITIDILRRVGQLVRQRRERVRSAAAALLVPIALVCAVCIDCVVRVLHSGGSVTGMIDTMVHPGRASLAQCMRQSIRPNDRPITHSGGLNDVPQGAGGSCMLLSSLDKVSPGEVVAAAVLHPQRPEVELIRPGVTLEAPMIKRLEQMGIGRVWIRHDAMQDMDSIGLGELSESRVATFHKLRDDFSNMSNQTISSASVAEYRQAVIDLTCSLIGNKRYAGLTDQLFSAEDELFSHCSNVAYLSLLVGLQLEEYIVKNRSRLSVDEARDVTTLGIGAMLHDIGKVALSEEARAFDIMQFDAIAKELDPDDEDPTPAGYKEHPEMGYKMLRIARAPASSTQIVLCHHQRFDGRGFPDMARVTDGRRLGAQKGEGIHIFCRIVAVADTLDHLLRLFKQRGKPPIAAMHTLMHNRFDGWFDPVVVRRVLSHVPPFPVGSEVTLNTGSSAAVIAPNTQSPCRPVVRLLADGDRDERGEYPVIDLAKHPEIQVAQWTGMDVTKYQYELSGVNPQRRKKSA